MENQNSVFTRRQVLTRLGSGLLVSALSAEAFAEELQKTPWATEGPYYPYNRLPLDRDNDLVIVGKSLTPAVGTITQLSGRVLTATGAPIRNAVVEIWQTDGRGVYLASRDRDGGYDGNFQGWGRFETDSTGAYRFRTIRPVVYPGRSAPHVHLKITAKGYSPFTTQLFIKGHPGNARDSVYGQLGSAADKAAVTKVFAPVEGSEIGEQFVSFDIVMGATPHEGGGRGGPGGFGGPPPPPLLLTAFPARRERRRERVTTGVFRHRRTVHFQERVLP